MVRKFTQNITAQFSAEMYKVEFYTHRPDGDKMFIVFKHLEYELTSCRPKI
jgi:hypothetical protein